MSSQTIRVILVDDHEPIRRGIRHLLQAREGIEVIAEAEDGATAVRLIAELVPDLVVMDINMPVMNGIEAMKVIALGKDRPKVIALSCSDPTEAHAMLSAGASDFIAKERAFEELASAIEKICSTDAAKRQ